MQKCRELSKLPKARIAKSLNVSVTSSLSTWRTTHKTHENTSQFHRTKPGSLSKASFDPNNVSVLVDASHPAAQVPKSTYGKTFPRVNNSSIQIRAFPKALLMTPGVPYPDPPFPPAKVTKWSEQLERLQETPLKAKGAMGESDVEATNVHVESVDIAMVCLVSIKATHKSAVIRKKIVTRLKTVVSLLATRGAQVQHGSSRLVFQENEKHSPEQWISPSMFSHLISGTFTD